MAEWTTDERIAREQAFHNERFGAAEARKQDAFYFAVTAGAECYKRRVQEAAAGRDVLEYGCACGLNSVSLAAKARSIVGIDISDVAIGQARAAAAASGVSNATFHVDNAERLSFQDGSFDVVFGSGILHHLDFDAAIFELRRVLRPGGRAIFWEPLGHNAAINLYRRLTPHARTADEHPLLRSDFDLIRRRFGSCEVAHFGLCTLASIPFRGRALGRSLRRLGEGVDRHLLRLPVLRWQAWYALMDLRA